MRPGWRGVRAELPELPSAKFQRFVSQYGLSEYDAARLVEEKSTADYFEATVHNLPSTVPPKAAANWMLGELFGLMKRPENPGTAQSPAGGAGRFGGIGRGRGDQSGNGTGSPRRNVRKRAFRIGNRRRARAETGLGYRFIAEIVRQTLEENPGEVTSFQSGKETVLNWLFGQVMKKAAGKANPQVVRGGAGAAIEGVIKRNEIRHIDGKIDSRVPLCQWQGILSK